MAVKKQQKGFTLLIAIVVTSILLLVSFVIANIALKQIILVYSGQESQYAFYNAESGLECAMYWDAHDDSFGSGGGPITCNGQTISDDGSPLPGSSTGQVTKIGGPSAAAYHINFQPPDSVVPAGYQADSGETYSAGRGYGWESDLSCPPGWGGWCRDRHVNSDKRLDTFIFQGSSASTWNLDLPNGDYLVSLASGDAGYAQGPHRVVIEGQTVINDVNTNTNSFEVVNNFPVTVGDGKLTMTIGGSGGYTMINYIDVVSVVSGGGSTESAFELDFIKGCAIVTVDKSSGTTIESRGYNTCDTSADRRFERAVRITY